MNAHTIHMTRCQLRAGAAAQGVVLGLATVGLAGCSVPGAPGRDVGAPAMVAGPVPPPLLVRPGHVLFRVQPGAVGQAMRAFEDAGFTVVPGGPPDDLVNAMLFLDDGWFIELFGLGPELRVVVPLFLARVVDPPLARRFSALLGAPVGRLMDWSVDVDNVDAATRLLRAQEIATSDPRAFRRVQVDGSTTSWEMTMPAQGDVPFLKGPYRGHIAVTPEMRRHRNSARGLAGMVLGTPHLQATRARLALLAQQAPGGGPGLLLAGMRIELEEAPALEVRRLLVTAEVTEEHQVVVHGAQTGIRLVPLATQAPGG